MEGNKDEPRDCDENTTLHPFLMFFLNTGKSAQAVDLEEAVLGAMML